MVDSSPLISMGSPSSLKPWGDFDPQQEQREEQTPEERSQMREMLPSTAPLSKDISLARSLREGEIDAGIDDLEDLPGWDTFVGCGYDVLNGLYADESSCLDMLFDLKSGGMSKVTLYGDKHYKKPRNLIVRTSYKNNTTVCSGNSLDEYTSKIATKAKIEGSYSFFSASVENDIGISRARSKEYSFTKVQLNIGLYTMRLPPRHEQMLLPYVKEDIDNSENLDDVFDTYGTHYLASVVMGAHASYNAATRKSQFSSELDVKVGAAASFNMAVNASASLSVEDQEAGKSFTEASITSIKTSGGNPALGDERLRSNLAQWTDSVKDYITLADFGQMIGIWKLASTSERQNKLKEHYWDYCQRKQTKYTSDVLPLTVKVMPVTNSFFEFYWAGRPDVPSGPWCYFGQVNGESGKTIVVKETEAGSGMLGEIASWERIATSRNTSFWRGIPAQPVHYVVLSDFARVGLGPPTAEETKSIKAVHKSCVVASDVPAVGYFEQLRSSYAVNKSPTSLDEILDYILVVKNTGREAYHLKGDRLHVDE